jgi:hypothetical protein
MLRVIVSSNESIDKIESGLQYINFKDLDNHLSKVFSGESPLPHIYTLDYLKKDTTADSYTDAFSTNTNEYRGPLNEVFKIVSVYKNFEFKVPPIYSYNCIESAKKYFFSNFVEVIGNKYSNLYLDVPSIFYKPNSSYNDRVFNYLCKKSHEVYRHNILELIKMTSLNYEESKKELKEGVSN